MEGARPTPPERPLIAAIASLALATALGHVGCSHYIGTTASSFLRKVRDDPDPNVRYLAYAKLAAPNCYDTPQQKAEAVELLVSKLKKGAEPVASRAVICHTLGELRDPAARDAIVKATSDTEGVVRIQACRALGKVGRPEDATLLARTMALDALEDCRIAAVEALAELKPGDPRITRMLVGGMQQDDPAIRLASLNALRTITGRDMGVDPAPWVKLVESQDTQLAASGVKPATPAGPPPAVAAAATAEPPSLAGKPATDKQTQPAAYPPVLKPYPLPKPPADSSPY